MPHVLARPSTHIATGCRKKTLRSSWVWTPLNKRIIAPSHLSQRLSRRMIGSRAWMFNKMLHLQLEDILATVL